jgi:hypothetical protein
MADTWAQRGTALQQKIQDFASKQKHPMPDDLKQLCNDFWTLCNQLIAADSEGGGQFIAPSLLD